MDALTTMPSSADTAMHVTSDLWPVSVALGVAFSKPAPLQPGQTDIDAHRYSSIARFYYQPKLLHAVSRKARKDEIKNYFRKPNIKLEVYEVIGVR